MASRRRRRSRRSRRHRLLRVLPVRWQTRIRYATASGRLRRRVWLGAGALMLLAMAWVVVTGLIARSEIGKIETQLREVRQLVADGRVADAGKAAAGIPGLAKRAHLLTSGPAWWTAAEVPYFGEPLKVMRGFTAAGEQVGVHGVQTLIDVASNLDPRNLRTHGDTIAVGPLQDAAPRLATAAQVFDHAQLTIDHLPTSTWFDPVNRARAGLSLELHAVTGYVDAAANATRILPTLLGATKPQRYFIGLQNESEMRGTGGLPGAFAIANVSHGTIKFSGFYSDILLLPPLTHQQIATGLEFGKDFDIAYGSGTPTSLYVNSNSSPNFPYAAQIWATMWEKVSGQHVDGAIAMDPTALAYFLAVTGPVTLPSGISVGAQNIVPLTERDEYAMFNDNLARKDFLVSILKASSNKLLSGSGSALTMAHTAVRLSNMQRLLVWSRDPASESVLAASSYGGAIPTDTRPLVGMVVNNVASGKLDYYLTRTIDYERTGCGSMRDVIVTMTLTNHAPAFGLPTYVTGRLDSYGASGRSRPGDNRTLIDYYASPGALLLSATLNGQPTTVGALTDLGHPFFRDELELPLGTTQVLSLHLSEPAGLGSPQLWRQPGVTDLGVKFRDQAC
jgi:hypothetical protein